VYHEVTKTHEEREDLMATTRRVLRGPSWLRDEQAWNAAATL